MSNLGCVVISVHTGLSYEIEVKQLNLLKNFVVLKCILLEMGNLWAFVKLLTFLRRYYALE